MKPIDKSQAPTIDNAYHAEHVRLLTGSFFRVTGNRLAADDYDDEEIAQLIFNADKVVVSHGIEKDPIFNYANRLAMELFEMSWTEFVAMPSRLSAEAPHRDERARLMRTVATQGFIDNYSGVRISKSGKRFMIEAATVWNVTDTDGKYCGQAATFDRWRGVD
ncbi:MAG: MEKHLA domain-containing protein [Gammaproteobacteria bacterium]